MLTRRQILKALGAAGLTFSLPRSTKASVTPHEGPLLAVFNATGGWDTTYLMDPKGGEALNQGYHPEQIQSIGALSFAPTAHLIPPEAMSNEVFFARYASELLVVNGVDVSVNNHTPCARYIATGELGSLSYPTLPALFSAALAPQAPLSFLTFGDYSATGDLIAQTRIPYLRSLRSIASVGYTDITRARRYQHDRVEEQIEEALSASLQQPHALPHVAQMSNALYTAQQSAQALSLVLPLIDAQEQPSDLLSQRIEIALAGFASGLTASANFTLGSFDSHNSNDADQLTLIPRLLAGVDLLLRRAEELGVRDRLTVVIQSEMGRTPWYNATGGKDHWSITSMMMIGPQVSGGRVVGGTTLNPETSFDQHPELIDPLTLERSTAGGVTLRPEHLQWALRDHFGLSTHPLALNFPLDLPEGERLPHLLSGSA